MMGMKIGELAERAEVNLQTLRYYEREKLLPEPPRLSSGYRVYPKPRCVVSASSSARRISGLHWRKSGNCFPCASTHAVREKKCARSHKEAKIDDIESKIRTLNAMKAALQRLTERCSGCGPASECPILESIDSEEVLK